MAHRPLDPVIRHIRAVAGAPPEEGPSDAELLRRFAVRRDESAFTALVERHGPMVLGVCRRVLHNQHDAEDAFQATFLVLARKAGEQGWRDSIAAFLYGVAQRVALKARGAAARRRARQTEMVEEPAEEPAVEEPWRGLKPILDEEVRRLPEKYRVPLVLCYLEGKSNEEAARLLGRPVGTLWSQLSRGRELLRERLVRRGLALSAAALGMVLADNAAPAAVPADLLVSTARTATGAPGGQLAAPVAALVKGVLREMSLTKMKLTMASLLLLAAAGLAAAMAYRGRPAEPPPPEAPKGGDAAKAAPAKTIPRLDPKKWPAELKQDVAAAVQANDHFALDLYGKLAGENQGKNLFFSPYSVSSALAMVAEGARGETADQMGKVLRFPDGLHRTGDEARQVPWDVTRIHLGLAALNEQFNAGNQAAPKQVRDKLATLRKELKAINQRAADHLKAGKVQEYDDAARKSQKLAAEINTLQAQYDQYELRVANALWGEKTYPFKQSYLDTLHKHYQTGGLFPVDFLNDYDGARKRINGWVEEQTHDRIKDLIPANALSEEEKKLVRLVLTNAIYFKGEWAEVFDAKQTKDDNFTLAGGTKVRLPMMHKGGMHSVRYAAFNADGKFFNTPRQVPQGVAEPKNVYPDDRGFAMLEMPYKGDELSMVLIAPRSAGGLEALEKKLTAENIQSWIGKLQKREVHVFVPKFKVETKYVMEKTLQAMGMTRAFKDPRLADGAQFDEMSQSQDPSQKLYVSKVLHKAFVEVNEKGTEAAAATAVMMFEPTSLPATRPFTPTFKADRPFVFLIRDTKTGSILFLGRMMNPKEPV